jgi:hypothetical protein
MGLPHRAPVHRARKVNIAPVGAMAVATIDESRVLKARPIPDHMAMMT